MLATLPAAGTVVIASLSAHDLAVIAIVLSIIAIVVSLTRPWR